ncbi:hypothetical protein HA466_0012310 [Hirschfeldia incana]|nr:hypothetical protein HA466_0012310 [Hirschfeldia incana]
MWKRMMRNINTSILLIGEIMEEGGACLMFIKFLLGESTFPYSRYRFGLKMIEEEPVVVKRRKKTHHEENCKRHRLVVRRIANVYRLVVAPRAETNLVSSVLGLESTLLTAQRSKPTMVEIK